MAKTIYPQQSLVDVKNISFTSFLDLSRWLAAAIVFLAHLRNPLFVGYGDIPASERNPIIQAWYVVTGWHSEAVVVFFVLSGFLVGGLGAAKVRQGSFKPRSYLVDRLSRLYVAFIPALILTLLLDFVGSTFFGETGFYTHLQPMIQAKIVGGPFLDNLNAPTFLLNVAMLQTIITNPLGSNDPLWTISYEFWFYISFGILLISASSARFYKKVLVAGVSIGLIALLGWTFAVYMGLWLIGVACAFAPRRIEHPIIAGIVLLIALFAARLGIGEVRGSELMRHAKNYTVAISFAWLLVSMRTSDSRILRITENLNKKMAEFSFSLYLIHFPLMLFILGALYKTGFFSGIARGYSPNDGIGLVAYFVTIALVYLAAWAFAQVTEMQTWKVRKWANKKFGPNVTNDLALPAAAPVQPPTQ